MASKINKYIEYKEICICKISKLYKALQRFLMIRHTQDAPQLQNEKGCHLWRTYLTEAVLSPSVVGYNTFHSRSVIYGRIFVASVCASIDKNNIKTEEKYSLLCHNYFYIL